MFGALIEYWYYTQDASYVNLTQTGLLSQTGPNNDYMPPAQNLDEGNDDQGFWGLAVMAATEYNFPNPPEGQPQWLALAQAVFNTQAARWDAADCNGGLRWQIFRWNSGYDYKNSISQACFFALGARLALYTGNQTYADWATKTWDWMVSVKFIDENYYIYDGAHIGGNCSQITPYQFTYNSGGFMHGVAAMWNLTEDQVWKDRLEKMIDGAKVFFPKDDIMEEVACEPVDLCDLDEQSFKAYMSRWMAATTKWAPFTYDLLMPWIRSSAVAAASLCIGGDNGRMCGLKWNTGQYDGTTGVGQQMAAMETTLACMIKDRAGALTQHTGGTSKGNSSAGSGDIGRVLPEPKVFPPVTAGDKAGAAILTILVLCGMITGIIWIVLDESSNISQLDQLKSFHSNASAQIAAFAAGGGAAALTAGKLHRKGKTQDMKEKRPAATVASLSELSSQTSAENMPQLPTPMVVGHVRNESSGSQRRFSAMPLGWPHNTSLRGSALVEPHLSRPQSVQLPPSEEEPASEEEAAVSEEEPASREVAGQSEGEASGSASEHQSEGEASGSEPEHHHD